MSKFLDFLSEPQKFSHWCYIVAQEAMTKEDFAKEMDTDVWNITQDWVHFHLWYDEDGDRVNQWWTWCGHIKSSKPVWSF